MWFKFKNYKIKDLSKAYAEIQEKMTSAGDANNMTMLQQLRAEYREIRREFYRRGLRPY